MDAKQFFDNTAGQWRSLRTTHHLPFRRAETGSSDIKVEALGAKDEKIAEICAMHEADPSQSVGGAYVSWNGAMAWDKTDENHTGETVFALIPEDEQNLTGKLLRERGYAEIVPVAGQYNIDSQQALVLTTEYETMTIFERFWFIDQNTRLRTSTVQRFGGYNTATFCIERKMESLPPAQPEDVKNPTPIAAISGW
jgi:hypothetical protein